GVLKEQKNLQNHIPGCQMVSGITIKECDEGDCKSRLDEVGKGNGNTDLFKRKICSEAPVFHSIASQTWIWVTCALLVWVTECIVRWRRQQSEIRVIDVILHPCNVVQLTLLQQGFSCSPGQYVLIQCPVISRFEWHPFTVTSCPTEYGLNTFSILMRAQGDWSNQLLGLLRSFIPSRQESSESMLNNSTIIYSSITSQNEQYSNRSTVLPHLCYYPYVHNHQTSRNLLLEESPQLYPPSRRQTNLECRYMLHVPLEFSDSISDLQCYCENSKALCSCVERDNFNAFNNCAKDLHSPNCVQESETRLVKKPLVQVESPFCAPKRKINSVTVCSDSKSAQACELNYNLSHSSKVTCNSISCLCFHNAFPYFLSGVSRNHSKQLIKNTCHDMRKLPTNHKSKRNETRAFSYIIKKSRTKCDTLCDSAEENREKKNYTDEIWHSSLISLKIDGPYCSSGEEMLQYPVIISVAGGIGITPLAAALSHKIVT
ncbi:NADPH oxidase 1, partial [Halocaridina rubra]